MRMIIMKRRRRCLRKSWEFLITKKIATKEALTCLQSSIENKIIEQTHGHTDLKNVESWDNLDIDKVREIIEGEISNEKKHRALNNYHMSKENKSKTLVVNWNGVTDNRYSSITNGEFTTLKQKSISNKGNFRFCLI